MNVVLPVKPVEQLVPLGGTAWLLLLCSPGVVPDFLRPNRLRTNLLQTVKKISIQIFYQFEWQRYKSRTITIDERWHAVILWVERGNMFGFFAGC